MKKYIFLLMAAIAILSGCKKTDTLDWKIQNELWLEQNKEKFKDDPNFHVSPTGLQYRISYAGNPTDARPSLGSSVNLTYTGTLINGAQFDAGTFTSTVGSFVPGFNEGIQKIHAPGRITLYIPWQLGYLDSKTGETTATGTEGTSGYIPPYSVMIFDVKLNYIN